MEIIHEFIDKLVIFITTIFPVIGWFFRHKGRLPATKYRGKPDSEAPFCMVCYDGVTRGDKIRVMPKCKHCYHVECIDAWLEFHSTCPICRDQVIHALNQEQRFKRRNVIVFLLVVIEDLSSKLGYPIDFGMSYLSSCA
ncbi:RING-H2 finger protein ATL3 [Bienertia sinuspersici]